MMDYTDQWEERQRVSEKSREPIKASVNAFNDLLREVRLAGGELRITVRSEFGGEKTKRVFVIDRVWAKFHSERSVAVYKSRQAAKEIEDEDSSVFYDEGVAFRGFPSEPDYPRG